MSKAWEYFSMGFYGAAGAVCGIAAAFNFSKLMHELVELL